MLIDISRRIHSAMAIYPGNPPVQFEQVERAIDGKSALTAITLGSHTGTHIDAPSHVQDGVQGIDMYPLEQMVGVVTVVDVSRVAQVITAQDLPSISGERIIFKTSNSAKDMDEFDSSFVALDETAAQALVAAGIKLVGIDGPSIKKKGVKDRVHQIFLEAGVVILEGLWLRDVILGSYELICLPLSVQGLDGVPVRAVLRSL